VFRHPAVRLVLATTAAVVASFAAPSWAAGVPQRAAIVISPTSGPPGTRITVVGTGFGARERVVIAFVDSVHGPSLIGTALTDGAGRFHRQATIPSNATTGAQMVGARGATTGRVATTAFTVTAAFAPGDVFVSVSNGKVQWRRGDGSLVATLDSGLGGYTTGSAFDGFGNLFVTDFGASALSVFDTQGNLAGNSIGAYADPESIVFAQNGDYFVGQASGSYDILEFASDGSLIASFDAQTEDRGTDWIALEPDQCTIDYTSEGTSIKRFDVCAGVQLTDFVTGLPNTAYEVALLPDGGMLVADTLEIDRLDASGAIVQTYDAAGEDDWFNVRLAPDGTSFWAANPNTANVVRFDLGTGAVLQIINTGTGGGSVFGLAVFH
jgi:hypothetical protein